MQELAKYFHLMKELEKQKIKFNLMNIFATTLLITFSYLKGQIIVSLMLITFGAYLFNTVLNNALNLKYYKSCYESLK